MSSIFNQLGYLTPGFHNWTSDEVNERLVMPFTESKTRANIFHGYSNLCTEILDLCAEVEQWINGSFVTNKLDPNDLDLVNIIPKRIVDSISEQQIDIFLLLIDGPQAKHQYMCDSYFVPLVDRDDPLWPKIEKMLDYWEKWWGEDRNGLPKGKVRVYLERRNEQ